MDEKIEHRHNWCLIGGLLLTTLGLLLCVLPLTIQLNASLTETGTEPVTGNKAFNTDDADQASLLQQQLLWSRNKTVPASLFENDVHKQVMGERQMWISGMFAERDKANSKFSSLLQHLTEPVSPVGGTVTGLGPVNSQQDGDDVYFEDKHDLVETDDVEAPDVIDSRWSDDIINGSGWRLTAGQQGAGQGVISDRGGVRRLPQAIIIGVKKGGTRALLEFLRIHPDVRAPGPELHYFDKNYDLDLEWYRQQMPVSAAGQLTIEKTPSYFVARDVPSRIYNMSRDIRLVVVVRDPVTRAVSDYAQALAKRPDMPPFDSLAFVNASVTSPLSLSRDSNNSSDVINISWGPIRIGLYARYLANWLQYFSLSQMHFVSGERLIEDPAAELRLVQRFLGLKRVIDDKHFYFNSTKGFPCLKQTERCLGNSKGRPHPHIDSDVIERLRHFYRPHNRLFYAMTGVDFGWP